MMVILTYGVIMTVIETTVFIHIAMTTDKCWVCKRYRDGGTHMSD